MDNDISRTGPPRIGDQRTAYAEPAHAWGMALYSFREATRTICEMAKSPDCRDMAVNDLGEIADAVLAANLMWSQLKSRKAA